MHRAWNRWAAMPLLILTSMTIGVQAAEARPGGVNAPDTAIVLPGAHSAEGIAKGPGNTFYAGELFTGNIYKGDVRARTAALFIDAPDGRQAVGMSFDVRHDLLFVAGGATGQGYVYDVNDRSTVATFQFHVGADTFINDVALTQTGAWFTDSVQPQLYFVPINPDGTLGAFTTLPLTGPAADTSGQFNLNGIVATPNGRTLIVAHTGNGELYTVNPVTGASALIEGISVPDADGLVLRGQHLWVVQNTPANQVSRVRLAPDLGSGTVIGVIQSGLFHAPSTAALFGNLLAVVNTHFDTGIPPTAPQYEVVLVSAS